MWITPTALDSRVSVIQAASEEVELELLERFVVDEMDTSEEGADRGRKKQQVTAKQVTLVFRPL